MVDELEVAPMWMATVQGAVAKFNEASPDEQEVICLRLGEDYGPEAADKARELFKAERARVLAEAIKARPKPASIKVVRDEDEEPRKSVGSRLGIAPGLVGEVADFTVS